MNSQELIDSIKSRALVPISQTTFSQNDLLSFATDIMRTRIVPFMIRFQEDYFLKEDPLTKVQYYFSPSTLVLPDRACEIVAINGNEVEVTLIPILFEVGSNVDFISPKSTFDSIFSSKIERISGKILTLTSVLKDLEPGTWIVRRGESPVPQIPSELHPLLAQAVAVQLLESLGFIDKAEAAEQTLERMESYVVPLLSPRIGKPHKRVINRNQLVKYI